MICADGGEVFFADGFGPPIDELSDQLHVVAARVFGHITTFDVLNGERFLALARQLYRVPWSHPGQWEDRVALLGPAIFHTRVTF